MMVEKVTFVIKEVTKEKIITMSSCVKTSKPTFEWLQTATEIEISKFKFTETTINAITEASFNLLYGEIEIPNDIKIALKAYK